MRDLLLARASGTSEVEIENDLVSAFKYLISTTAYSDPSILTTLLKIPGLAELEACQALKGFIDPIRLYESRWMLLDGRSLHVRLKLH